MSIISGGEDENVQEGERWGRESPNRVTGQVGRVEARTFFPWSRDQVLGPIGNGLVLHTSKYQIPIFAWRHMPAHWYSLLHPRHKHPR
jgi:hypothetical protein